MRFVSVCMVLGLYYSGSRYEEKMELWQKGTADPENGGKMGSDITKPKEKKNHDQQIKVEAYNTERHFEQESVALSERRTTLGPAAAAVSGLPLPLAPAGLSAARTFCHVRMAAERGKNNHLTLTLSNCLKRMKWKIQREGAEREKEAFKKLLRNQQRLNAEKNCVNSRNHQEGRSSSLSIGPFDLLLTAEQVHSEVFDSVTLRAKCKNECPLYSILVVDLLIVLDEH
ncbi:hypothetical protein EK904_002588, partial [Melospiza melodia maxima]